MDENLHDIDKLFRDPIEEHEEIPSARVWDAIDSNLDKSNIVSIKKKYNNLKKLAVALLLLLLGTIAYEVETKKTGNSNVAVNESEKENNTAAEKKNVYSNNNSIKNDSGNKSSLEIDSAGNNYSTSNALKTTDGKNYTSKTTNTTTGKVIKPTNSGQKLLPVSNETATAENKKETSKNQHHNDGVAAEITLLEKKTKLSQKKSSGGKTLMRFRNATVEELADQQDKSSKSEAAVADKDLTPPENTPAEKFSADGWKKGKALQQINGRRLSPEANFKNRVAKNAGSKIAKPFHFSLTPFVSPQISFNRIEDDHHDTGPQPRNGREQIKSEEQHQSSNSLGVLIDMPVGKNWSLQSGITYVNKKTAIEPKKIFAKLDPDGQVKYRFDCASGYTYIAPKAGTAPAVGDSVNASASTNTLKYIGVPVAVNYSFTFGKLSIIPTFGIMANFLVKQQIQTEIIQGSIKESQTINTIQGLKPAYFNAISGIAFEYNISKRTALSIMPSGNFALSSINKDAAVKSYPNSFGLNGGIKIKF